MRDKTEKPLTAAELGLLGSLPPTDPTILKAMEDRRISARHYAALGRVAAVWSEFEAGLDLWIWMLIDRPASIGVCVTGQMIGIRPRLDSFIALVRQLGAPRKWNDKLENLAKSAIALAEQRNRVIHDMWDLSTPTNPRRFEATARRTVRFVAEHQSTDELDKLTIQIAELIERLENIANSIFTDIRTSSPGRWPLGTFPVNYTSHPPDKTPPEPESPPDTSLA